jgi:hypothetical protein
VVAAQAGDDGDRDGHERNGEAGAGGGHQKSTSELVSL